MCAQAKPPRIWNAMRALRPGGKREGKSGARAAACDVLRVVRGCASLRALGERRCAAPRVTEPQLQLTQPAAELLLRRAVLDARCGSELFRDILKSCGSSVRSATRDALMLDASPESSGA